jgi:hypothetical protein
LKQKIDREDCQVAMRGFAAELLRQAKEAIMRGYEEAGVSGLCDEGRIEAALGALDSLDIDRISEKALGPK